MAPTPYFRTALREELAKRQRTNPAYSLRAFAKHLGMQAPTLSAVLSGRRPLSMAAAESIPTRLAFTPAERKRFVQSVYYRKAPPEVAALGTDDMAKQLREELHYKIIAQWEHYAILSLADTRGFRPEGAWVGKRLGISETHAQVALDRLKEAGLMSVDALGKVRLHQVSVRAGDGNASSALRQSHREALTMALEKLEQVPVHRRDYSSITFAVSPDRLGEAREMVRAFRKQLSALLAAGPERTEVFQLCVQLYPLTGSEEQSV